MAPVPVFAVESVSGKESCLPTNYPMIAQQARVWLMDETLARGKHKIAKDLFDLASQLSDPRYGCDTEYFAVEAMTCCLCRSTAPKTDVKETCSRASCRFDCDPDLSRKN
jgi:hypothetical protein